MYKPLAILLVALLLVSACASADASKARSRAVIESGGIVKAEELRVAEYVAYYKQSFPPPANATLGLDLRMGNPQVPVDGGAAWLQVGVQARSAQDDMVAPLNLAIVVDRSGSMDSPEKMPLLKQSLKLFLRGRGPNDLVALVAFADDAEVVVPSRRVDDGRWIDAAVDRLQPSGYTNVHAGLIAGLKEVERGFDVRRNNRVVLLTDGIANRGVTDPGQIAREARAYNDRGIHLSTIGLGREFNDPLLVELANQGKGAYHFVDSAAEMERVFEAGVAGLIQKAAGDVTLLIRPEPGVVVDSITGFQGKPPAGPVQIRLRDMGTGDSQVVLVGVRLDPGPAGRRPIASVELRYQDMFSKREESASRAVLAEAGRLSGYDPAWDVEVLRNVTIQATAEGLREIDRLQKAQRYLDAWRLAQRLEQDLSRVARLANDDQLVKDAATMRRYQDTLARLVEQQTGRAPTAAEPVATPGSGVRQPLTGERVPTIEIR